MKLHLASPKGINVFTGYGPGYVAVNGVAHHAPLVVLPDLPAAHWPVAGLPMLTAEAVAKLLEHSPEIIILGTGATQQFPGPAALQPLQAERVGLEIMDTPAACRTYNILVAEERRVLAAIWLP
ncbi:MAG: Mth938-like domain-containing protein [Burkholderiales bacterium]